MKTKVQDPKLRWITARRYAAPQPSIYQALPPSFLLASTPHPLLPSYLFPRQVPACQMPESDPRSISCRPPTLIAPHYAQLLARLAVTPVPGYQRALAVRRHDWPRLCKQAPTPAARAGIVANKVRRLATLPSLGSLQRTNEREPSRALSVTAP